MKFPIFAIAAIAAVAFAQTPTPQQPAELKTYLNLTDTQVTALQTLRTQNAQALAAVLEQIRTKQAALEQAVQAPGANAAALGQALLEIQALRQQVTQAGQQRQTQALALLTADQRTRLQGLAEAQRLQPAVRQAEGLSLLTHTSNAEGGFGRRFAGGFEPPEGARGRGPGPR